MSVCLVRCPSPFLIDERVFPPLGLYSVATALDRAGIHAVVHDDPEQIPGGFECYGFGPTAPEYPYAVRAMKEIKGRDPLARVVIGGPHASINAERVQKDGWDCVVVGDGELVAAAAFTNPGIRKIAAREMELDDYPIIDRGLFHPGQYHYLLDGRPATTVITSRGCPHKCGFCCKNQSTVRMRSTAHVIREIDQLHSRFGYRALAFPDDIFILDKKRALEIAEHLGSRGIIWRCLVRADMVVWYGMDFLRRLRDCGCVEVGMGIESGSEQILRIVRKGESVQTIKGAIGMLKDCGIRVKGFFIVGLPGESPETLEETRSFLEAMQLDDCDIKIFRPYPGSPIYENRDQYDIDWDDDDDLSQSFYKGRPGDYTGSVRTSRLTNAQIVEAWCSMEKTFKKEAA